MNISLIRSPATAQSTSTPNARSYGPTLGLPEETDMKILYPGKTIKRKIGLLDAVIRTLLSLVIVWLMSHVSVGLYNYRNYILSIIALGIGLVYVGLIIRTWGQYANQLQRTTQEQQDH